MKKIIRWPILLVSLALELIGIFSLLYINKIIAFEWLGFYDGLRLLVKYVIAVIFMAAGILSFSLFGNFFEGKAKRALLIGGTTYSTVLTLPLLYVFVGCFFTVNGATLPMVNEISDEFVDIFKSWHIWIFAAGVIMSLIFLAVPIITTVISLKSDGKKGIKNSRRFDEV